VDWANPEEKGLTWSFELIATGGAAAELIMKNVESKLRSERDERVEWLETQAGLKASDMIEDVLTGKRFTWPDLVAIWQPITYETRELLFDRPVRDWYAGPPHLGFVLVWKWGDSKGIDDLLHSAEKKIALYADVTNNIYRQLYRRQPNADELSQALAGFNTYGSSYADTIYANAVQKIYQAVLGRAMDDTGKQGYANALANGWPLEQVRYDIAHSPETQGRLAAAYQAIWGRPIGQDYLEYYTFLLGLPDWTLADIVQDEKERYLQTVVLPVLIAVSVLQ
jgi:hypothetical protein